MAERGGRGARGEGVVYVHHVEVHSSEEVFQRPAEVDRHRSGARPGSPGHRDARSDGKHRRPAVASGAIPLPPSAEQRRRPAAGRVDRPAGLTNGRARSGRRRHNHAMPSIGQGGRYSIDELVELVRDAPRLRAHLDDRHRLPGHVF